MMNPQDPIRGHAKTLLRYSITSCKDELIFMRSDDLYTIGFLLFDQRSLGYVGLYPGNLFVGISLRLKRECIVISESTSLREIGRNDIIPHGEEL